MSSACPTARPACGSMACPRYLRTLGERERRRQPDANRAACRRPAGPRTPQRWATGGAAGQSWRWHPQEKEDDLQGNGPVLDVLEHKFRRRSHVGEHRSQGQAGQQGRQLPRAAQADHQQDHADAQDPDSTPGLQEPSRNAVCGASGQPQHNGKAQLAADAVTTPQPGATPSPIMARATTTQTSNTMMPTVSSRVTATLAASVTGPCAR